MKKGIHPNYRPVVFQDAAAHFGFLTQSTAECDATIQWTDGVEYPLYKLDISSASHPFFTGKMKFLDTTGRVEKFQNKFKNSAYAKRTLDKNEEQPAEKPAEKPAAEKPAEKPAAKPADAKK